MLCISIRQLVKFALFLPLSMDVVATLTSRMAALERDNATLRARHEADQAAMRKTLKLAIFQRLSVSQNLGGTVAAHASLPPFVKEHTSELAVKRKIPNVERGDTRQIATRQQLKAALGCEHIGRRFPAKQKTAYLKLPLMLYCNRENCKITLKFSSVVLTDDGASLHHTRVLLCTRTGDKFWTQGRSMCGTATCSTTGGESRGGSDELGNCAWHCTPLRMRWRK